MASPERTRHKSEIVICSKCEGKGHLERSELQDYHKGEYRYWDELCSHCEGSGRIITKTETIETVEPYNNSIADKLAAEIVFKKLQKDKQDK